MRLTLMALLMMCSAAFADEVKILVRDAAGEPADRVRIQMLDFAGVSLSSGKKSLVLSEAVTDEEGRATVSRGWAGRVCFLAFRGRQAVFVCNRDATDGKPIEVTLGPAAILGGIVRDDSGAPIEGAQVRAIVPGGEDMHGVDGTVKKGGMFFFPALPVGMLEGGSSTLEVACPGYMPEQIELHAVMARGPIEVTLHSPRMISGRVVAADGGPVIGARVVSVTPHSRNDPALYDDDLGVKTDGSGGFSIGVAANRRICLYVVPAAQAPRRFEVEPGAELLDLGEIVVEPGKEIHGTVREFDDRAIVYGFASLEDEHGFRVRSAQIAADGKFSFPHVGDGRHGLTVWIHEVEGRGGSATVRVDDLRADGKALDLVVQAGFLIHFVDEKGEPVTVFEITGVAESRDWPRPWEFNDLMEAGMTELRLHAHGPAGLLISVTAIGFLPVSGVRAKVDARGSGEVKVVLVRDPAAPLRRPGPTGGGWPAPPEPKTAELAKINLPPMPTKDQVRAYLKEIVEVVGDRRSFSSTDPEVGMMIEVGPKHVDVLIEFLREPGGPSSYIEWALERLITEEHRTLVLEQLESCKPLVQYVVKHGWADDARATLLGVLEAKPTYVPTAWIEAVASYQDPETYPLLLAYLVRGSNPGWTYRSIKDLPGIDLGAAVAEAWHRSQSRPWDRRACASAAAEFGHVDALALCIESLALPEDDHNRIWNAEKTVRALIDFAGSNEEIAVWFAANRENLEFDPKTKKYRAK